MFRSSKMARTMVIGLLAAGLMGGVACSSDDSDSSDTKTTTTVAGDDTTASGTDTDAMELDEVDPAEPGLTGASDDPQDYIDELTTAVSSEGIATAEQGRCIGESWIDVIGFDAIVAADISPAAFGNLDTESFLSLELSSDEGGEIFDAFKKCGLDFPGIFRELSMSPELTDAQQACIADALNDDAVRAAFVKGLVEVEGDQELESIFEEVQACTA